MITLSIALYTSGTWSRTVIEEHRLRVFEKNAEENV